MTFLSQILIEQSRVVLILSVVVILWLTFLGVGWYKLTEYKRRLKSIDTEQSKKTLEMALNELDAIKQQVIIKARAEIQQAEHVATVTAILNRMKEHCPDCYAEVAEDIKKAMRLNDLKIK